MSNLRDTKRRKKNRTKQRTKQRAKQKAEQKAKQKAKQKAEQKAKQKAEQKAEQKAKQKAKQKAEQKAKQKAEQRTKRYRIQKKKGKKIRKPSKKSKIRGSAPTVGCRDLNEAECEKNERCAWNVFNIEDFNLETNNGRQKLWDLRESIVKGYTEEEREKTFGTKDPTLQQVYTRALKEYRYGLRGLCGEKMFRGENLSDILKKRVKEKYPDLHTKKKRSVVKDMDQATVDQVTELLKEAEKSEKPSEEIQRIIEEYGMINEQLGQILDKNNESFGFLVTPEDPKEIDNLLKEVTEEVDAEVAEDALLEERIKNLKSK